MPKCPNARRSKNFVLVDKCRIMSTFLLRKSSGLTFGGLKSPHPLEYTDVKPLNNTKR